MDEDSWKWLKMTKILWTSQVKSELENTNDNKVVIKSRFNLNADFTEKLIIH